jgi:hypothetical protein
MRSSERGAVTIHVAIALIAMLVFAGVVIDNGVMYSARRQAQNSADAGALAGALTLEWESLTAYTRATEAAKAFANQNAVWGEFPVDAHVDVTVPITCPDSTPNCIRVDVLRGLDNPHLGTTHGNTIPTYMMGIVGLGSQGVRATATAQVAAGNAVKCIKPWVVADKWTDNSSPGGLTSGAWDQNDTFDPGDVYVPGTDGFFPGPALPNDYGMQLVLKQGDIGTWSAGWSMEIDLGATGSNAYNEEIEGCPTWVPTVGLSDPGRQCLTRADESPEEGCVGVKTGMSQGPTSSGVATLIGLDPDSTWNTTTNQIDGGCMQTETCQDADGNDVSLSARVVPLAIFDPAAFIAGGFTGTNGVAKVMNLLGFFVEGMCNDVYPDVATRPVYCGTPAEANKMVVGRLMSYPGQFSGVSGAVGPHTFLKIVRLVQ